MAKPDCEQFKDALYQVTKDLQYTPVERVEELLQQGQTASTRFERLPGQSTDNAPETYTLEGLSDAERDALDRFISQAHDSGGNL